MGEVIDDGVVDQARRLARLAETVHVVSYYSAELVDMTDDGYRGWWHAYFGYRPAPMGAVSAATVTATFYNFAPRMVERAVPGVWQIASPEATTAKRLARVEQAWARIGAQPGFPIDGAAAGEAVEALRGALDASPVAGRPLFGAYAGLDWPTDPIVALWHACTLIREYRFDGHNVALAAADIDGVACHVLMAGLGHGNRSTILAIRGWTEEEWGDAETELRRRGWLDDNAGLNDEGRRVRSAVEAHTDTLSAGLVRRLGPDGIAAASAVLEPLAAHLLDVGEVSGKWPPPHLARPDATS